MRAHRNKRTDRIGWLVSICLCVAALTEPAVAQPSAAARLDPVGSDVRVRFLGESGPEALRGTLLPSSAGTLLIQARDSSHHEIREADVQSLEVSLGRSHGSGALRGLGIGALSGSLLYGLAAVSAGGGCTAPPQVAFVLGGLAGGALGLWVGAMIGVQRWQAVRWRAPTLLPTAACY